MHRVNYNVEIHAGHKQSVLLLYATIPSKQLLHTPHNETEEVKSKFIFGLDTAF